MQGVVAVRGGVQQRQGGGSGREKENGYACAYSVICDALSPLLLNIQNVSPKLAYKDMSEFHAPPPPLP
ncbi:hypothetical protein E2542_SST09930 [Spatholobus suberectus]|nr:hypothetical protein E2542_SST09930 [Spatholobus suberectus]